MTRSILLAAALGSVACTPSAEDARPNILCPTLDYLVKHRDDPAVAPFLALAVDKRPAEELYDIRVDPGCLDNLAGAAGHAETLARLRERLTAYLEETGDPRVTGNGDVWETYPRYSPLRWFPTPEWALAHPERVPHQEWLEARRPFD